MSHNLYIEVDGKRMPVVQTPSWVTRMCMASEHGVEWELTGKKKCMRAINCYLEWARGNRYDVDPLLTEALRNGKSFKVYSS